MLIYQAGPLFTEAEQNWQRHLTQRLKDNKFEVIWPGDLITASEVTKLGVKAATTILERDLAAIKQALLWLCSMGHKWTMVQPGKLAMPML